MLKCFSRRGGRVLLLTLPLMWLPQVAAQPLQKTFNAWQVSCNNLNACEARNILDHRGLVLKISRSAGKTGKSRITLEYGREESVSAETKPIVNALRIDGRTLKFNPREWEVEATQITTGNRLVVDDFIRTISEAVKIQLVQGGLPTNEKPTVDLRGLKAALLLIDEQQSRIDTRSAWVRKGLKAADNVPDAPAAPRISADYTVPVALTENEKNAITQQVATQIDTSDCSLEAAEQQLRLYPLDNHQALALIACERGAYNQYDLAYVISRSAPYKADILDLAMPFALEGNANIGPELINVGYDARYGIFSTYAKGRGIGDCGTATRWQFDGQQFQLVRYAEEHQCDGYSFGDEEWPTLWVTRRDAAE